MFRVLAATLCAALGACAPPQPPHQAAPPDSVERVVLQDVRFVQDLDGGSEAIWSVGRIDRRKRQAGMFQFENYSDLVVAGARLRLRSATGANAADPLAELDRSFSQLSSALADGWLADPTARAVADHPEWSDTVSRVIFDDLRIDTASDVGVAFSLRAGLGRAPTGSGSVLFEGPVSISVNEASLAGANAVWLRDERAFFFPGAHTLDGEAVAEARMYRVGQQGEVARVAGIPDPARYEDPFERFEQRMFAKLSRRAGPTLAFMLMQGAAGQQEPPSG